MPRPYVLLSVATTITGHIEDSDQVDQIRAESDAILIGAETIRRDNPQISVKSEARRAARVTAGKPEHPLKVTLSASGNLDPDLEFWHHGGKKVAYTTDATVEKLRERLTRLAEVVSTGWAFDWGKMLDDLGRHGVQRLLVEGGGTVHTQLVAQNLADELHFVIAPVILGDAGAPRFLNPAVCPWELTRRMRLAETRQIGNVALMRFLPKGSDER